jgi:Ca2+-binding RTX toxin-like protein
VISTPNEEGRIGFAGAGVRHNGINTTSGNTKINLTYSFVKAGTDTLFIIDQLSLGIFDLDQNFSFIGDEQLEIDDFNDLTVVAESNGGLLEVSADEVSGNVKLDPTGSANSPQNRAVLNFSNTAEVSFTYTIAGTNPRGYSGGWNLVGGNEVDFGDLRTITVKACSQFIDGGSGNDRISGDNCNDFLNGNGGNDLIFGESGDDLLDGGSGKDRLYGEIGDDILNGDDDNDFLFGGSGDDLLDGGSGKDRLYGGTGDDILEGGDDNDFLFAGSGDDWLRGERGDDILYGQRGVDTFILASGEGTDQIRDYESGIDQIGLVGLTLEALEINQIHSRLLSISHNGETLASIIGAEAADLTFTLLA